jgi:hypothetical protein
MLLRPLLLLLLLSRICLGLWPLLLLLQTLLWLHLEALRLLRPLLLLLLHRKTLLLLHRKTLLLLHRKTLLLLHRKTLLLLLRPLLLLLGPLLLHRKTLLLLLLLLLLLRPLTLLLLLGKPAKIHSGELQKHAYQCDKNRERNLRLKNYCDSCKIKKDGKVRPEMTERQQQGQR